MKIITIVASTDNENLTKQVEVALKDNTRVVKYKPYSTAAVHLKHELVLTINPIEIICNNIAFRVIPMYKNTAVSNNGMILDYSKMYIRQLSKSDTGYLVFGSYDNLNNKVITPRVHRLVALAWVPNDDYLNKNIIDHRNGIKTCNHYDNLRWVTSADNIAVGRHNGIIGKFKVYPVDNITYYTQHNSIRELARFIKIGKDIITEKKLPRLVKNSEGVEYLVMLSKDIRDSSEVYKITKDNQYIFKVVNKETNEVIKFDKLSDVRSYYGLKTKYNLTKPVVKELDKLGYRLESTRSLDSNKSYNLKNLITNKIHRKLTPKKAMSILGCGTSVFNSRASKKEKYGLPIGDWLVGITGEEWPMVINKYSKPGQYKLVNNDTNETKVFESMAKLSTYLDVTPRRIRRLINKKEDMGIYTITRLA